MALGTTNISLNAVRILIGESSYSLFTIGTSALINKWSKYKPVIDDWPQGTNGDHYGFNMDAANPNKWDYLHPRGGDPGGVLTGIDEPVRLGDFRGYEHSKINAFPSIQCRDTDNTFNATLYPTGSPWTQQWICRAYRDVSSVLIIPSDLGLDNYYIGIKLSFAGATWYKTIEQVHHFTSTGTPISVSAELVTWSGSPSFSDLPYGFGTCDWQLILSSTSIPAWANGVGGATIIYFPTDTDGINTFVTSGSFTVGDWVLLQDPNPPYYKANYFYWAYDSITYQGGTVYATDQANPEFHIDSYPTWITPKIYSGGSWIQNATLFESGMELRLTPTVNSGNARDGWVVLHSPNNSEFRIYVVQQEAPGSNPTDPVVVVEPLSGEEFTISSYTGSIAIGSNQLTYTFVPAGGYMPAGTSCNVSIINNADNSEVATDVITARDGYTSPIVVGDRTITISENAIGGSRYIVRISIA